MTSPGVTLLASLMLSGVAALLAYEQGPVPAEARAVSYLAREVPAWRRDHPCYSCHNNGDAARALIAAGSRHGDVRAALDDTLRWLAHPARWESNGGGEGGADDKRLARIQFAQATTAAYAASLVPQEAVARAADIVASDQRPDGSWLLDSSDSIGSPATYGTALATVFARRTLQATKPGSFQERIDRSSRWLAQIAVNNLPDAAAILFTFSDTPRGRPGNWQQALSLLKQGQGRDGGWGPYRNSPAEAFDTALALLALQEVRRRPDAAQPVFSAATLDQALANGRSYLVRTQLDDGSWNETTRPAGQTSYAQRVSTTAWALLALLEMMGTMETKPPK
jgi:hypothetical protein